MSHEGRSGVDELAIAPPLSAALPLKTQFTTVGDDAELYIPPPKPPKKMSAVLATRVQLRIVGAPPTLSIPPPLAVGPVPLLASRPLP